MAKVTKFIVTADCFGRDKQAYRIGDILELDLDDRKDCDLIALMSHSERLAVATEENVKAIMAEKAKAEKGQKDFEAQLAASPERMAARVTELEKAVAELTAQLEAALARGKK